jgi:hypothetical protein
MQAPELRATDRRNPATDGTQPGGAGTKDEQPQMKHRFTRMGARGEKLAESCSACKRERDSSFVLSCFWCISWFLRRSQDLRRSSVAAAVVLCLVSVAAACNVPVFRFALERWRPDAYRAVLFHRGELSDGQRELVQPLIEREDRGAANVTLRMVDVTKLDEASEGGADAALFASLGDVELPLLVVQYPRHLQIHKPVWSGPPSREAVLMLVDSSARQELVRRLAEGQTAVWLMLDSGKPEQDDAAAALVAAELNRLEAELELPELTDAPEDELTISAPLKIGFSLLRVRRDDPAEAALVSMLIHSEPDLAERDDPMVFPVYGRGRALWALIGAGITAKNVSDSAGFLVGPCSCEVKELNPGFDLLLSAEWDVLLSPDGTPLPAVPIAPAAPPAEAELVPIPTGSTAAAPPADASHFGQAAESAHGSSPARTPTPAEAIVPVWIVLLGGASLVGVVGLVVLVSLVVAAAGGRKSA